MELSNEFVVPTSVDDAWAVLTDVERIAPCMPGARLEEVDGEDYKGLVKVKVGPVTVEYKGTAKFLERDEAAHKAVLRATGRETRGQGNASATVTAQLQPEGDSTRVAVTTELDITGRVAQFGRGMLADVSTRLLNQFVERLEADVLSTSGNATATVDPSPARDGDTTTVPVTVAPPTDTASSASDDEALDLGKLIGKSIFGRIAAGLGAVALGIAVIFRRRRRHHRSEKAQAGS